MAGKVESGSVQNGDKVIIMPVGEAGMIKGNRFSEVLIAYYYNYYCIVLQLLYLFDIRIICLK